ncbi:glutamine synthetase family protein [Amycolatopsis coloradensis]|uniref:Glutamine synthetase family protein n=1 Tax=Amycolatopsis coloradensis TaxID=76021 RepID=A0ACD5BHH5_9PSEU
MTEAKPGVATAYANVQRYAGFSTGTPGFIDRHGLWSEAQREEAAKLDTVLDGLDLVRVVYGDPHGLVRSKTLTVPAFRTVLRNGMDASPGPLVFDTGHAVAIDFFTEGAGIGVPELTGAGDFVLVPDPHTFRVLPHQEAAIGWVVADEYLRDGTPHPLSSRAVLKRQSERLAARSLDLVVGLEIEWTLTRFLDDGRPESAGGFGIQGSAPSVAAVNAGYQFNLDLYVDQLLPVIAPLARAYRDVDLPLRTIEHESGPGQLECTFSPMSGLAAADAVLLIRSLTKQVCARLGYHASFMALPSLPGLDPSGWHLHQSLYDLARDRNAFATGSEGGFLSTTGSHYLGGLLEHAESASLLCVPTVNGYRRMADRFSLSPDRVVWSVENRGTFLRVLGGEGDPVTHIENRIGEPCANPYLFIAAQTAAGLDGIDRGSDPGMASTDPHATDAAPLPDSLAAALEAFESSELFKQTLGEPLWRALLLLKRSEWTRYQKWAAADGVEHAADQVTDWEQREYFEVY